MGIRIADEYNSRDHSYLSLASTVKAFIPSIVNEYLGVKLVLTADDIKFEKKVHTYNLEYKQEAV